jgi:hypothetical protein
MSGVKARALFEAAQKLENACKEEDWFCLSQVAGLSIILPTPHWKPRHASLMDPVRSFRSVLSQISDVGG